MAKDISKQLTLPVASVSAPRPGTPIQSTFRSFHPHLVVGTAPGMSEETLALLGSRLKAATLLLFTILSVFLARAYLLSSPGVSYPVQVALLLVLGLIVVVLYAKADLSLPQLRALELAVMGSVILSTGIGQYLVLADFDVALGYLELFQRRAAQSSLAVTWLLLVWVIFIPNHWRRVALIAIPIAFTPVLGWKRSPNDDRRAHMN